MTFKGLINDALQIGITRVFDQERRKESWACKCSNCGELTIFSGWKTGTGIPMMQKHMERDGWNWKKKICPTCVGIEEKSKMSNVVAAAVKNIEPKEYVSDVLQVNPKLQRKIYALLDDHFNETTRLYDNGWSDEKIAKEAKASVQFVTTIREEAYGKLAEDPAITKLRAEIAELRAQISDKETKLMSDYDELDKALNALEDRINKQFYRKAG